MYEVRNAVRGSYAVNGDTVQDLVGELRDLADQLSMNADDLEFDQDSLNEDISIVKHGDEDNAEDYHAARWYIGGRNNFELSTDDLGDENSTRYTASRWSHTYKNIQEMEDDIKNLQSMIQLVKDLEAKNFKNSELTESKDAKFNKESVSEDGCSDKEDQVIEEDAGNTREDLMKELQEALLKNGELEKDNLSLQEKLSVCSAKETKLNEELTKYKKVSANLSDTAKKVKSLEESVEKLNSDLDYKDRLIESKNERLNSLITFKKENISKLTESDNKISDLENQIKVLKESVEKSNKKLSDMTTLTKKYQRALKESKERYIAVKADACGLSVDNIKAQLNESYSYKDIDSICNELVEQKLNMSKLPFRLNENVQFNVKSSQNEYIKGNRLADDEVSDYLLQMIK